MAAAFYAHFAYAAPAKIVVDVSHGQGGREFTNFNGNLTALGHTIVPANKGINSTVLSGASFLFLGSIWGRTNNYTEAEVSAIKNWFNEGGKAVWVATDSDYGAPPTTSGYYIQYWTNRILETIGSKIRVEPTSVEDPQSNAKAAYRVVANVTNTADPVKEITTGVGKALFHGPTILYGLRDGTAVDLETTTIDNVYWVMKTSRASYVKDNDPTNPPIRHTDNQQDSFVIMAVEKFAGPAGNNKIIVSGENPYGGYQPIFSWTYYGVALDGPTLIKNTVQWGLRVEGFSERYGLIIGIVVAVVAVGAGGGLAYLRARRRATRPEVPKPP